jgi:amino acid adenylation domain-containing protein
MTASRERERVTPEGLTWTLPDAIECSLPRRFASVVATWPSRLAVATGDRQLTYAELDRRSDALMAAILRRKLVSDAPVALLLDDPISTITGLLATWKTGKACVPLDPTFPQARLDAILRDTESGLVITDGDGSAVLKAFSSLSEGQLRLNEVDLLEPVDAQPLTISADSLACLLYTSGSTGEPKGIMRSHRGMLHRVHCSVTSLDIQSQDRVSALHSMSSAAGLRDVLTALLAGAALLPFDLRRAGMRALAKWIDREEISILCAVVSTFRHLLAQVDPGQTFRSVRIMRLGGEPLFRQDIERSRSHFRPGCLFVVGYGATEASVVAEYRMHGEAPLPAGRIPAGYAQEGVEILVVDEDGRSVGDGQIGEVAVRSRYLFDGYWRRPDLTRAVLLTDPTDRSAPIYRTGDVGRLRSDGCLELLGRKDDQVKIRGQRVHPGEIEMALVEHAAIREAVVTASVDGHGETRLVAYVVPEGVPAPDTRALRHFLQGRLPAYMVPSAFVTLAALPTTAHGKLDRAALPPPSPAHSRRADILPPRNPREQQIAAIWEDLFGVAPIGANDDFFDLGGDSLLAAAFVAAVEEAWGRVILPSVLLDAPTVAELAMTLLREDGGLEEPLTALRVSGNRPPVFFVHNDYGRGLYTRWLARCLDLDRPFYAVHLHGLSERALPTTVEKIAANRLRSVRAARPHGPYVLGGHCHGGIVALEMARQLQAEGERIGAVVLVDTEAPGRDPRAVHHSADWLGRLRRTLHGGPVVLRSRSHGASNGIAGLARYYRRRLRLLARSGLRAQIGFLRRTLAWAAYRRAIRRYAPSPYSGRVALFRAEEFPAKSPDLGWSELLPRLEVVVIPGDHYTCVTRHVAALGARLEEVLRRVESGDVA